MDEPLYTVRQIATQYHRSMRTVHRWLDQGLLKPTCTPFGRPLIAKSELSKLPQSIRSSEDRDRAGK